MWQMSKLLARQKPRRGAKSCGANQKSTGSPKMLNTRSTRRALTLAMLLPLLTACAGQQANLSSGSLTVKPAAVPALPPQARQQPVPPECSPTCSSALTKERGAWQQLLTNSELGALPASAPTAR